MKSTNTSENGSKDPAGQKPPFQQDEDKISPNEKSSVSKKIWKTMKTGAQSIWIIVMVIGGILAFIFSLFLL